MKTSLLIVLLFILTGFSSKDNPLRPFTIHINYTGLPSGTHYDYLLTNSTISLKKHFNAIQDRPEIVYDKASFKLKSIDSLVNHIYQTDWSKVPKAIDKGCIDGYYYYVTINRLQDTFNFKVNCSGHADLNKLLDLCNFSIPNKKYRNKFRLWHDN